MSSQPSTNTNVTAIDAPRRALSARQAATVEGLTEAAMAELSAVGYSALTVRNVAKRAGVAPATAYTYFGSKEHLVAEVFWRRFRSQPAAEPSGSVVDRATGVLSSFALLVADEADLAAACTVAVLADDPDVSVLRERIGTELHRRLLAALGSSATPSVVTTLQYAVSGALLQVGTGHLGYDALPEVLENIAETVLGASR
ncbi:MAG: TetR/AcrR family transcriptional regulator [Acidimicrobiales bacterium]|nr:TetR/AcrR family transcriptional regulator [Acidimicrobiales bacterium]